MKEKILDIFNERTPVTFQIPTTDKDTIKIEWEFEIKQGEEWFLKHMRPTSMCWSATKGGPIQVTANFEQYKPTTWELFKDWLHSKIFRHERYW